MPKKIDISKRDLLNAKEWFLIGDREFNFAKLHLEDRENKFYAEICFFFHQAAEKYLKGFLVAKGAKPDKIHDLGSLCLSCAKIDKKFNSLIADCSKLNKFYIASRYPLHVENYSKKDANDAFIISKKVIGAINDNTWQKV
jgi:HEPN domain-containing protein